MRLTNSLVPVLRIRARRATVIVVEALAQPTGTLHTESALQQAGPAHPALTNTPSCHGPSSHPSQRPVLSRRPALLCSSPFPCRPACSPSAHPALRAPTSLLGSSAADRSSRLSCLACLRGAKPRHGRCRRHTHHPPHNAACASPDRPLPLSRRHHAALLDGGPRHTPDQCPGLRRPSPPHAPRWRALTGPPRNLSRGHGSHRHPCCQRHYQRSALPPGPRPPSPRERAPA